MYIVMHDRVLNIISLMKVSCFVFTFVLVVVVAVLLLLLLLLIAVLVGFKKGALWKQDRKLKLLKKNLLLYVFNACLE